jgi:secreted PhoX family phosphatase
MLTRRNFTLGLTSTAFAGLALSGCATSTAQRSGRTVAGYGPLQPDPLRLIDLPQGFSYRIISKLGDRMDDGFVVPDRADGMGAFRLDDRRMALVRNHELAARHGKDGPFRAAAPQGIATFDRGSDGRPLPGGTTTIIYDYRSGRVEQQFLSLVGTIRNCAGGTTPWGSWLTCEEDMSRAGSNGLARDHGWIFEVPAARRGLTDPVPLTAMGRFNHEAAAVDPRTGIVYLTEDRDDSLFYRFLPDRAGELARGGRLQALAFRDRGVGADSRNWSGITFPVQEWRAAEWIDIDGVEAPEDDLRKRGHARGAALFARGEGIHFGDGELYFCCTNGGTAKLSQIMRYRPSSFEGQTGERASPGQIQIFVESTDAAMLNFGDNITVAPNGHLIVCEDQYTVPVMNHLRGITPAGDLYTFARLHEQTELAGACFSPDGATMFVNVYDPTKTLAITGPWKSFRA